MDPRGPDHHCGDPRTRNILEAVMATRKNYGGGTNRSRSKAGTKPQGDRTPREAAQNAKRLESVYRKKAATSTPGASAAYKTTASGWAKQAREMDRKAKRQSIAKQTGGRR